MVRLASVCPCLSICSSNLGFGMEYMELARKSENINHGSVFADFRLSNVWSTWHCDFDHTVGERCKDAADLGPTFLENITGGDALQRGFA